MFGSLFLLLLTGYPLAFLVGGVAVGFIAWLWSPDALALVPQRMWNNMTQYLLAAIPLFIFMASMLEKSGLIEEIFDVAYKWLGRVPGGLAVATVAASTVLAAMVGVIGAAVVTMALVALPAMLRRDLPFTPGDLFRGRNRRPPRDPVNALLSFAYTLLTKDLTVQAQLIGFDPYWGFYHRPKFGRPALALDLAEEFRPLIADSVVITALNNGEITSAHVRRIGAGYTLTDDGRRTFLRVYERRLEQEITHPRFRYRLSYRRLLDLQPRFLAAVLLGELPAYQGFETR
jgi:hypothetical protein